MRLAPVILALSLVSPAFSQTWSQWAGGPGHTGSIPVIGQRLSTQLAKAIVDPHAPAKRAEAAGNLLTHYQTPLSDGDDVFMVVFGGAYTNFSNWHTQTWSIRKFQWEGGQLVTRWTTPTDWSPAPPGGARFEPVFHAAITEDAVYLPAANGTVLELDRGTGAVRRRLGGFGGPDANTYVISPISIDANGNLFYNALKLSASNPWSSDHQGAWLVKITPDGVATRATYASLVPGAPLPNALCTAEFGTGQLPWPPSPNAVAPSTLCGSQRAGLNIAPAIGDDGTVYTVSRTHLNSRWGWMVAVNNDLTPKWATSLRNRFNDGCNVLLPPNGTAGGCRSGATTGVDPSDNQPGSGAVNDNSTSSPVLAPDGTIYYGAYTRYNHSQGHLMRFSAEGAFLSAYKFGWDVTPALWEHDGTFSIITKENRYETVGTYCSNLTHCLPRRVAGDTEGYYITQLSPELNVQWQFKSTNTLSCERQEDGTIDCVDNRPGGFEWCVNSVAVDERGVVFVNSEDGHLYAINQGGTLRERIFLQLALGAAYTPLSLGADGKLYTQNAGLLFVVGTQPSPRRRAVRK